MAEKRNMAAASTAQEQKTMSGHQLRDCRLTLGLSQVSLGVLLRLGKSGSRTVRRWEAELDQAVPGPVSVAMEALAAGWRPGDQNRNMQQEISCDKIASFLQAFRSVLEQFENEAGIGPRDLDAKKGDQDDVRGERDGGPT